MRMERVFELGILGIADASKSVHGQVTNCQSINCPALLKAILYIWAIALKPSD